MGVQDVGSIAAEIAARPDEDVRIGTADRVARIYAAVHQAVLEQRLQPATKLPEDQLGSLFGASRTLVRSALQSLAKDGIVVLARNRGASVASPGPREARDLFEARRVVEAVTTARAALQATPADFDDLETSIREGQQALASGDRGRAIRLSGSFHLRLAQIADQAVLGDFLRELVARSSLVIALYGHRGRSDCGDAEHAGLIEALRRGDAEGAVRLMTEHLNHIEADLDLDRKDRGALPLGKLLVPDSIGEKR